MGGALVGSVLYSLAKWSGGRGGAGAEILGGGRGGAGSETLWGGVRPTQQQICMRGGVILCTSGLAGCLR